MLAEKAVGRLLVYAARGNSAGARAYLGTMLPRSTPCAQIRAELVGWGLTPAAIAFLEAELPWLVDEGAKLARDGAPRLSLRERLDAAGNVGLPKSEIADDPEFEMLASFLVSYEKPTGGRPKTMMCLALHDPRFNTFAPPRA